MLLVLFIDAVTSDFGSRHIWVAIFESTFCSGYSFRARARARVCVFIFFHHKGFFRLQDVQDILERYGSAILCCEYLSGCFCQVLSSLFPNLSYFTSKNVTPARRKKLERKRYDILCSCEKMIYRYRI